MTVTAEAKRLRVRAIINIVISATIGIVWNVLAALILFRSYNFFEAAVLCLLVMLLSSVATMRADFEPGGMLGEGIEQSTDETAIRGLRSIVKSIFYGIAGLMALLKLVLALIAN